MPHLALNTVLPRMMAVKYQVAISIAPIGLMFASFGPGFLFAFWLEEALGIPPNSSLLAHENGTIFVAAFLACMLVLMVVGYALGWLVNHAVSRWLLGWSAEKVRAVYFESDIPSHWLKPGADQKLGAAALTIAQWEQQRKVGALRFIVTRGIAGWGLPMFVGMYGIPALFGGAHIGVGAFFFNVALFAVAGAGFGAVTWYQSEAHCRALKKRSES